MIKKDSFKEEAEKHWAYIESILLQQLEVGGKMYVDAMVHGYKHGMQDSKIFNKDIRGREKIEKNI